MYIYAWSIVLFAVSHSDKKKIYIHDVYSFIRSCTCIISYTLKCEPMLPCKFIMPCVAYRSSPANIDKMKSFQRYRPAGWLYAQSCIIYKKYIFIQFFSLPRLPFTPFLSEIYRYINICIQYFIYNVYIIYIRMYMYIICIVILIEKKL